MNKFTLFFNKESNKNIAQPPFGNIVGFGLNLKMVLYLENLCLTEKPRIFNPQPRQAPERCMLLTYKTTQN